MARTTRSTATVHEKDKSVDSTVASTRLKSKSKKRKRDSVVEHEDQPLAKLSRHTNGDQLDLKLSLQTLPLSASADTLLDPSNASQILDILEMVDTQGLLDRVFPLSTEPSMTPVRSCSFRTLLQESSEHPLRVLRAAIQHLFPISSHSRSRSSTPGAQQLRFCNLALSLLDQVSQSTFPISLDTDSLFSSTDTDLPASPAKRRKYALMQKLPSGEWWTSLNSDIFASSQQGKDLKDLSTGHSELASILPTPSTSTLPSELPTLGSYVPKSSPGSKILQPGKHRLISRGSFLDYGPFASFAPNFEQEGREVGRIGLGEVLLAEKRYAQRAKSAERLQRKRLKQIHGQDIVMEDLSDTVDKVAESSSPNNLEESLKGFLPQNQVDSIVSTLRDLELEASAQELLERNAKALLRLEELQMERLGDKVGFKTVEVGSEEWDTAQAILDSLVILTSLRPRSSADESVIPPASLLRRLHRTLPLDVSSGWYGNLPSTRTTALRDDTTVYLKSAALSVAVDPSLNNRSAASKPPVTTPQFSGYPSNYQTTVPYSTATSYATYTPSQGSYYQNYGNSTTTGYPSQQYSSSWFANYPQSQTNSGRATPIVATPVSSHSTMYQPPATVTQPQPQRAVANTVANKAHQGWTAGGNTGYTLTLPAHMRNNTGSSQPGSPGTYHQVLR